jgi:hypothetical protein
MKPDTTITETELHGRWRLPNCRARELIDFIHDGFLYIVGIGRFADGRLAEIFINAGIAGTVDRDLRALRANHDQFPPSEGLSTRDSPRAMAVLPGCSTLCSISRARLFKREHASTKGDRTCSRKLICSMSIPS